MLYVKEYAPTGAKRQVVDQAVGWIPARRNPSQGIFIQAVPGYVKPLLVPGGFLVSRCNFPSDGAFFGQSRRTLEKTLDL